MEQVRMLVAIVLSFLVFFLWNYFFVEKEQPPVESQYQESIQNPATELSKTEINDVKKGENPFMPPDRKPDFKSDLESGNMPTQGLVADDVPARVITVTTSRYTIKLSERTGAVTSCVLSDYRESVDTDSPKKDIVSGTLKDGTFLLEFVASNGATSPGSAVYKADTDTDHITVDSVPRSITFSTQTQDGLTLQKIYTFTPNRYLVDFDVAVLNQTGRNIDGNLVFGLHQLWKKNNNAYGFVGPAAYVDNHFETFDVDDLDDRNGISGPIQWVSMQHRYFMTCVIPKSPVDANWNIQLEDEKFLSSKFTYPSGVISSGTTRRIPFEFYVGPKSVRILKDTGYNLDEAVSFGFFDIIAKPCLIVMNYIYGFIPNYGIAIIILTIIVKLLFWPLGNKSYKSMNEMKKLQPLMAEIREKYKDDKKRMNEEVMGLYRTYKINPLGGCLPMVAQIPVFIALYQMLYGAIELRHAPFFGWINDLSAPDRLLDLGQYGIAIPLMHPPYGIPVLTIIMGATMFIQQKLQPPAGDPAQAKMMMFMPIIFTVIFINFSSGLVLYWLVNNILSIAQQYYVSKKNA